MDGKEFGQVVGAILVLFIVSGLAFVVEGELVALTEVFLFSIVIILTHVASKKLVAHWLDADVEHKIWGVYRYGIKPKRHFKKEMPFGFIVPLLFSLLSIGLFKVMPILTYETRALKHRVAKRFGFYSYSEMSEWHNGLIGASGIVALLALSMISYFPGWEYLSKLAVYYAFWNMVPLSNLDGTQIFFGSRILWLALALVSLIFALGAFVLL